MGLQIQDVSARGNVYAAKTGIVLLVRRIFSTILSVNRQNLDPFALSPNSKWDLAVWRQRTKSSVPSVARHVIGVDSSELNVIVGEQVSKCD